MDLPQLQISNLEVDKQKDMKYVVDMEITELLGKTASAIEVNSEDIIFTMTDGSKYKMYHQQDCCEDVRVEDVCGDIADLLNTPFVQAEESSDHGESGDFESFTWTFYKLGTNKGSVTIRWYGTSNGYYSEAVNFEKVE